MRLAEETYQDETEHSPSVSFTQFQGEIGGVFSPSPHGSVITTFVT